MVIVVPMPMVTGNASVAVVDATCGAGLFFWAHHFLVPPHGHGPENVIVMTMVDDAATHAPEGAGGVSER